MQIASPVGKRVLDLRWSAAIHFRVFSALRSTGISRQRDGANWVRVVLSILTVPYLVLVTFHSPYMTVFALAYVICLVSAGAGCL